MGPSIYSQLGPQRRGCTWVTHAPAVGCLARIVHVMAPLVVALQGRQPLLGDLRVHLARRPRRLQARAQQEEGGWQGQNENC